MKKNIQNISIFLLQVLAICVIQVVLTELLCSALADEVLKPGSTAYVTADYLRVHDAPQSTTILGQLPYGTPVTIVESAAHGYYACEVDGQTVYLYGQYLTGTYIYVPPAKPQQRTLYKYVYVSPDGTFPLVFVSRGNLGKLALRYEPYRDSSVIEWLSEGTPLLVINDRLPFGETGYFRVHTLDGRIGYAHGGSLKVLPPSDSQYNSVPGCEIDLSKSRFRWNDPVFLAEISLIE